MGKLIDLTGQRFGRLTVIERAENTPTGQARWKCACDCGKVSIVAGQSLRSGIVLSCGCYNKEKSLERAVIRNTTHGKYYTRLHRIWAGMKDRCYNYKHCFYDRYGGRGITVCDEWKNDFQAFYDWAMANSYRDDLSIDRIDNDKGYSPDNCRWETKEIQGCNKSNNINITINGESKTLSQWCRQYNYPYDKAHTRLLRGWSPEEALGIVQRKKK